MLDIKPILYQLSDKCNPKIDLPLSTSASNFFHQQTKCSNIIDSRRTKYPDVPKLLRISDKKQSIFPTINNQRKSIELIVKENPKDYIRSKRITDNEASSSIRHIGTQTDYREESTQTNPFSPPYTISGNQHPEVFALSDFTYGKGLPATSLEISFIERLRARREWEQDHTIDMTRTKIVIEREIREWQIRNEEIKMLQDTREKLFTKNLHTYIKIDEEVTQNIIDLFIYRQEKQLNLQHKRLEIETSRDIRRIKRMYQLRETQINAVTSYNHLGVIGMAQQGNGCFSLLKPPWHTRPDDIITTFKNRISNMYTHCSQFDYLIDRRFNQSQINIFKFEELLPKNALVPQIDQFNRSISYKKTYNKKTHRRLQDLERAFQLIQEEKTKQTLVLENKPLRFVEKVEIIEHVKQSQTISSPTEVHDRRRIAIIKFQNYLRSIIVQSKISNVRQIRQDLLEELRNGLEHNETTSTDMSDHIHRNEVVSPRTQIYDYLEGETISDMLDFLSKELLRLQSEQTIHLFILLADRYRYQREASETGFRTRSIERQKLEDRAFQEMFSLNVNCDIEIYLQDLILESISNTADKQARLEIQQITETLTNLTDEINNSLSNPIDIEIIVSELVHHFLFPTVQTILTRQTSRNFSQYQNS
ncbi:unnamed protein product [Adineta steineri]|uniref:Cilia- and flagella-associated protein 91 n=1 Tax=Adineta steineri TaxID=433720 RepID=A0A818N6D0_9BILA|nr:unnamed protein product [Adineta steineri]CAF3600536.1 unnamed protein product [Adineta steineri]